MASIMLEIVAERLFSLKEWEVGLFNEEPVIEAEAESCRRAPHIRPLAADDRQQMLAFARALPEEDLLFLNETSPSRPRWMPGSRRLWRAACSRSWIGKTTPLSAT